MQKTGSVIMAVGALLLAIAVIILCADRCFSFQAGRISEKEYAEVDAAILQAAAESAIIAEGEPANPFQGSESVFPPEYVWNPNMEMPYQTIDGTDFLGKLEIPALQLELPVIREWSYTNLRKAPCRYSGTAYRGNFVILAHTYDRHFGRLELLVPGDTILFTDMEGNRFRYSVSQTEILTPYDVEKMTEDIWDLTLFTCSQGGTSRLAVRCRKENGNRFQRKEVANDGKRIEKTWACRAS